MAKRASYSIFQLAFAVISALLLCLQTGGFLVHSHALKHEQAAMNTTPQLQEECVICQTLHLPLAPLQCSPKLAEVRPQELPQYYHPFSQAGYSVPEFAANPKSPPFGA